MNILHMASFKGNVGDNASHLGFYSILNDIGIKFSVDKIEIRKLYKNYKGSDRINFDVDFINKINSYDLCVIGGGGFLDYWVPDSKTGTTIDVDPDLVSLINIPTIFTSIGSNPHKKIPEGNIEKFKFFLDKIKCNEKIRIFLRNDGSMESIKRDLGEEFLCGITEILDHGFFYNQKLEFPRIVENEYVAINITEDQIHMQSNLRAHLGDFDYWGELKSIVEYCISIKKYDVVFVPHISSDLKAIGKLLDMLDDTMVRNNISVAPCLQGDFGTEHIFSIYKNSECVIGTRFHANVCSIAMGKKAIGLVALDRVEYLYRSLGASDRAVLLQHGFSKNVINIIESEDNCIDVNNMKNNVVEIYKHFFQY